MVAMKKSPPSTSSEEDDDAAPASGAFGVLAGLDEDADEEVWESVTSKKGRKAAASKAVAPTRAAAIASKPAAVKSNNVIAKPTAHVQHAKPALPAAPAPKTLTGTSIVTAQLRTPVPSSYQLTPPPPRVQTHTKDGKPVMPDYYRAFMRVFKDAKTGQVVLRFHKTDIVKVSQSGEVTLNTGGYLTATTQMAMNDALGFIEYKVRSYHHDAYSGSGSAWEVQGPAGSQRYADNMTLPAGPSPQAAKARADTVLKELTQMLTRFSQGNLPADTHTTVAPAAASSSPQPMSTSGGGGGGAGGGVASSARAAASTGWPGVAAVSSAGLPAAPVALAASTQGQTSSSNAATVPSAAGVGPSVGLTGWLDGPVPNIPKSSASVSYAARLAAQQQQAQAAAAAQEAVAAAVAAAASPPPAGPAAGVEPVASVRLTADAFLPYLNRPAGVPDVHGGRDVYAGGLRLPSDDEVSGAGVDVGRAAAAQQQQQQAGGGGTLLNSQPLGSLNDRMHMLDLYASTPPPPATSHDECDVLCAICMEHPRDTILIPCMHLILCHACADALMSNEKAATNKCCPMCRTEVDYVLEVE